MKLMSGISNHGPPFIAQPSVDRFAVLAFSDTRERVFELDRSTGPHGPSQATSNATNSADSIRSALRCMRGSRISRAIVWLRSLFGAANDAQRAATRIYASEIVRAYGQAGQRWVQQAGIAINRPLTTRQVARVEATRLSFLRQSRVLHELIPDHQYKVTPAFQALLQTLHAEVSQSSPDPAGDEVIQNAAAKRQSLFGPGALPGSLAELADLRNAWSDLSAWPDAERELFLSNLRARLKETINDFAIAIPVANDDIMRATHERLQSTGALMRPEPSDFALNDQWISRVKASFHEEIRTALEEHLKRVEANAAQCISGLQASFPLIPTGELEASEAFVSWVKELEALAIGDQLADLRERGIFLEPHLSGDKLQAVRLDEGLHPGHEVQLDKMLEACSVVQWPEDQQQMFLQQFRDRSKSILREHSKTLPLSTEHQSEALRYWQAEVRQALEHAMRRLLHDSFQRRVEVPI